MIKSITKEMKILYRKLMEQVQLFYFNAAFVKI